MKKIFFFASAAIMLLASCAKQEEPQAGPEFGLSPVINNVVPEGGTVELTITGKDAWTVEFTEWSTKNTDWCTTEVSEGEGEFVLKLNVEQAVSTTDQRSVIVEVSNGTKTLQSKIIQAPLQLGEGEVLIIGLDGKGRVWSAFNLADKGKFETDIEAVTAVKERRRFRRRCSFGGWNGAGRGLR